ncbi:hypothetical protein MED121_17094 [Marinomonas sp. MED121]|uniref:DUF2798 domain-containing protein n=1 Tax=Marinomonas sp. MED121 TaxID=314277 RepID=UPI0000691231|nr:DUF2798 domain-containing protein [Marinomonas sp. MED121]EAQ67664.1 hypothetical protein MED121_17094 [Marinomonas sp. MED121]
MKQRIIFALLMSLLLSSLMSCWVTWINLGFSHEFLLDWRQAFLGAWPVAAIIAFFIGPEIHKLSIKLACKWEALK